MHLLCRRRRRSLYHIPKAICSFFPIFVSFVLSAICVRIRNAKKRGKRGGLKEREREENRSSRRRQYNNTHNIKFDLKWWGDGKGLSGWVETRSFGPLLLPLPLIFSVAATPSDVVVVVVDRVFLFVLMYLPLDTFHVYLFVSLLFLREGGIGYRQVLDCFGLSARAAGVGVTNPELMVISKQI